jgi:Flp pilus assembly protein TadD
MVLARKVSKMCFFGLGWFFIFLIPVANIMPINSTMADHWMYLPSIGFYLAFIGGVGEVIKRLSPLWGRIVKIFAIVFGCSAVVMFVFLTVRLNRIWNDPVVFHQYVSKMLPKAFRPHNELGIIYLDRQMPDAAILELNKAIELKPGFDQAYANLGNAYLMKGDSMRALILREIADKKKPALQQAQEMKSYYETAILLNRRAIELTPENPKAYNNLGNAYLKLRRLDEAAAAYNKALSLNSQSAGVYNNLGIVYIRSGDSLAARKAWERALEIDPGFKMARDNLSSLR